MKYGEIEIIKHSSTVLENNPLEDPYVRSFPVYFPPSYNSGKKFPVVFLLAGFTGTGKSNLNYSFLNETIKERLDRLISNRKIREMIVVMPDCMTFYGGSQYINSSATGRYEDYIKELVKFVDDNYSTIVDPNYRAVCGKSSGGYGAAVLAMKNPDVFGLMCSTAGDMYFEYCYMPSFPRFVSAIEKYGKGNVAVKNFIRKEINTNQPKPGSFHHIIDTIAMSACYSPNPSAIKSKGYNFDLPFRIDTGELDKKVFNKWLKHDPVRMLDKYKNNLKKLKLIYLDAGTKDEFSLNIGARIFCDALKRHKIKFTHEEFNDGHFSLQYRYDRILGIISDYMK